MAQGLFEDVNTLSLLTVANTVAWRQIQSPESLPEDQTDGIDVSEAPVALLGAYCRKRMHHRSAWLKVDTFDASTTYQVTVEGTTVSETDASTPEVLNGLRDKINADGTINTVVTADTYDDSGDGTIDTLRLKGDTPDDYTVAASTSSGTGSATLEADATSFQLEVYSFARDTGPNGNNPARWGYLTSITDIGWRGRNDLAVPVNGMLRLGFRITGADGRVYLFAGPARLEE